MADLREPTTEEVVAVAIVLHREHCEKFPLLQPAHRPSQPGIYPNQPDLWRWSYDCQREAVAVLKALAAEPTESLDAEHVARLFHETYERLAPSFGYETRKASAVPWEDVPEQNKRLMIAVAGEVSQALRSEQDQMRRTVVGKNSPAGQVGKQRPSGGTPR